MTSYKPVFLFAHGERADNTQRFASYEEAEASAMARWLVWTMPEGYEVEETMEPVNYQHVEGKDSHI